MNHDWKNTKTGWIRIAIMEDIITRQMSFSLPDHNLSSIIKEPCCRYRLKDIVGRNKPVLNCKEDDTGLWYSLMRKDMQVLAGKLHDKGWEKQTYTQELTNLVWSRNQPSESIVHTNEDVSYYHCRSCTFYQAYKQLPGIGVNCSIESVIGARI